MSPRKAFTEEPLRPDLWKLPLMDFIPAASERFVAPYFFRDLIDILEKLPNSGERRVVDAPRRHTKSSTVHHAIAWWLLRMPRLQIIYFCYGLKFSYEQSRLAREIYRRAGGRIGEIDRQEQWTTPEGGGVFATSYGGELTGRGGDILIIDDPHKNREEVEKAETRNNVDRAILHDAIPCLKPDSPVLWVASRYHQDDASGRALARGAKHTHYQAINKTADGNYVALWPEVRPLDYLVNVRSEIGEYAFASNYQGEPQTPESAHFPGLTTYEEDGRQPSRIIIGVDLAYTVSAKADYTAIVVLEDHVDHYRVKHVRRGQWGITRSKHELLDVQAANPGHTSYMYYAGPERGSIHLLQEDNVPIQAIPAKGHKVVRAQRASQAWAEGRIRCLAGAEWVDSFVSELRYFTGDGDVHDDQVDALVSGFDGAEIGRPVGWVASSGFSYGRPVM